MPYEDFTTFSEQDDINDHIQEPTATHVDAKLYRNGKACLYKSYGVNHFDLTWEHKIDVKYISFLTTGCGALWALANQVGSITYMKNNGDKCYLMLYTYWSGSQFLMIIQESYNGVTKNSASFVMTAGIMYYLRIKRDGQAFTCKVYDTAINRDVNGSTGLLATLSLTLNASQPNHRYCLPAIELEYSTGAYWADYDIENLDLQEPAGEEHFVTVTEYLGALESWTRQDKTIHRTVTEKLGELDSYSRTKAYFRTITESLGLKDTYGYIATHIAKIVGGLKRLPLMLDKFLGWMRQPETDNPRIRGSVKTSFEETKRIFANLKMAFQETIQIKSKVAEIFEETMPIIASIINDFQETIQTKGSIVKKFEETVGVSADIMRTVFQETMAKVKGIVVPIRKKLEEIKRRIEEITADDLEEMDEEELREELKKKIEKMEEEE